jgi:hypothetical protein
MTSIFNPPKFKAPPQQMVAPIEVDAATDTKKRIRKPTGRSESLMAGVANALKRRLGE